MKICYLTRSQRVELGGLDRYSFEVISRVARYPHTETVVLVEASSGQTNEAVVLRKATSSPLIIFHNVWQTRRYIRDCDVIHAMDLYPYGLVAALACVGTKKQLIINGVGTESVIKLSHPLLGWLLRWSYQKAYRVLCISEFTKKRIIEKAPELKNLETVYLGVDLEKFGLIQGRTNENSTPILIGVGALKRRKGYHITIPAVGKLAVKYPGIKYYIVGSQSISKYTQKLKDLVRSLNLEHTVVFFENVPDEKLVEMYYNSHIFILTSVNVGEHFEGYGLVFLEAAACGLPTIGTRDCGIAEAMVEGKTGLLVDQENIDQTAEALDKLLSNPQLRMEMGRAGKEFAVLHTWDATAASYFKFYDKFIHKTS